VAVNDALDQASADARRDLARVQAKVEAARAALVRLLQETVVAEARLNHSQVSQLLEANEQLVVAAMRNQGEADTAQQALDEAARSAELDALTKLPNRLLLLDRLARAIVTGKRHRTRFALLFLDLDNFKEINDTLGHAAGDEVLQVVARRLESTVREADTVSRHGGDEFLILLSELSQPADAARIADKLFAALGGLTQVGDSAVRLKASIGISIYPDDGEDATTLIKRADAAMYQAKREGGSYVFHRDRPADQHRPDVGPAVAPQRPATRQNPALAEHERRLVELREANQQLVLAALSAQELQAAAQRAQLRQAEFLTLVARELASPMAPICLATTMLGRVRSDEPLLPQAQAMIERQMENMARLVAAVQDFSLTNVLALNLERREVDIVGVVDTTVAACRTALDKRQQSLAVHLPRQAIKVMGDPAPLAQIVTNLIDNATKYTPDRGEVGLSVALAGEDVVITVSDNGIGITEQTLPHIFEPFVQDIRAIGLNGIGAGIGLTVVRTLVEAHGGTVVASSAGGNLGSSFVVRLPRAG
jgi:diguanylate cyclase